MKVLSCPSDMPSAHPGKTMLGRLRLQRGINGGCKTRNSLKVDDRATGVCLNQSGLAQEDTPTAVPLVKVGLDYINARDGSATTLLLARIGPGESNGDRGRINDDDFVVAANQHQRHASQPTDVV